MKPPTPETEQTGNERKLDVSVSADGSEAFAYSRIGAGGFKFGELEAAKLNPPSKIAFHAPVPSSVNKSSKIVLTEDPSR